MDVCLGAAPDSGQLVLRTRRPGDTIVPLGSPGRRKLKKVLIERKIPRTQRDRLPLVLCRRSDGEEILWVVGVALSEFCRVSQPEEEVWWAKLEPIGS
jgi:tRNA(Ile)-lysidine synthase